MASSCGKLKMELAECIRTSPCMVEEGVGFHECLKRLASKDEAERGSLKAECFFLRTTYVKCKHSQLDMRTRFRGNRTRTTD